MFSRDRVGQRPPATLHGVVFDILGATAAQAIVGASGARRSSRPLFKRAKVSSQTLGRVTPRSDQPCVSWPATPPHSQLSSSALCAIAHWSGRSSIPETPAMKWIGRGVLDPPHARRMTAVIGRECASAGAHLHAIRFFNQQRIRKMPGARPGMIGGMSFRGRRSEPGIRFPRFRVRSFGPSRNDGEILNTGNDPP